MMRMTLGIVGILALGCSGGSDLGSEAQPLDECTMGTTAACDSTDANGLKAAGAKSCKPGDRGYVWGDCQAIACTGSTVACTTQSGAQGIARCGGDHATSECAVVDGCKPGDSVSCGLGPPLNVYRGCALIDGKWQWDPSGCNTPLVLAFHDESVHFTHPAGAFDLVGVGASVATDWVGAETPWLALDRDGNGSIDDGRELFGSMTELGTGTRASNGFVALADLDDDGDGWITPKDSGFSKLLVWRDRDQNRRSSASELTSAEDAGLVAISLRYKSDAPRCEDGNCEVERARFVFKDELGTEREGAVVDVHFSSR
jgi:hypothetical protein